MTKKSSIEREWAARFETLIDDPAGAATQLPQSQIVGLLSGVHELLLPSEMAEADRAMILTGTPGIKLMEVAGTAVAEAVRSLLPASGRVAVMTGPGNNGGDGFVAARLLAEAGYKTSVWMAASRDKLTGDAAFAAAAWTGSAKGLSPKIIDEADIIVDAIFGAGLSKPVTGLTARSIDAVNAADIPVIAVDLPSGIDGESGQVQGTAIKAWETITFFRMKPGHLLFPGRDHAGFVTVADIGIDAACLEAIKPATRRNNPVAWPLPPLVPGGHKYDRGHTLVVAGPEMATGAARLAARGAMRVGSGLVTIAATPHAAAAVEAHVTSIMVARMTGPDGLATILSDTRKNSVVMGPALGVGPATVALIETAMAGAAALVLDADALTSFAGSAQTLFKAIAGRQAPVVLTPHNGEFARLFPDLVERPSKLDRAREAARMSGAIIVLKGADTVIAEPGGAAFINDNAPPQLATAGSGDVLAGMIGGLCAQGMAAAQAAAAGVWLHGAAGRSVGRGLIAEDIPEALPGVFSRLAENGTADDA